MNSQNFSNFYCETCEYKTSNKKDYVKHMSTRKHQTKTTISPEKSLLKSKFTCRICGNCSNSRTTLWRHKKNCVNEKPKEENLQNKDDLIKYLMKENTEMKNLVIKVCQKYTSDNTISNR